MQNLRKLNEMPTLRGADEMQKFQATNQSFLVSNTSASRDSVLNEDLQQCIKINPEFKVLVKQAYPKLRLRNQQAQTQKLQKPQHDVSKSIQVKPSKKIRLGEHIQDLQLGVPNQRSGELQKKLLDFETITGFFKKPVLTSSLNRNSALFSKSQLKGQTSRKNNQSPLRLSMQVFTNDFLPNPQLNQTLTSQQNFLKKLKRIPINQQSSLDFKEDSIKPKNPFTSRNFVIDNSIQTQSNFSFLKDSEPTQQAESTVDVQTSPFKTIERASRMNQSQNANPFLKSKIQKYVLQNYERSQTVVQQDSQLISTLLLNSKVSLNVVKSPLYIREVDKTVQNTDESKKFPRGSLTSRILFPVVGQGMKKKTLPEHRYIGKSSKLGSNISPTSKIMGDKQAFLNTLYKTQGSINRFTKSQFNEDLGSVDFDKSINFDNTSSEWLRKAGIEIDAYKTKNQSFVQPLNKTQNKLSIKPETRASNVPETSASHVLKPLVQMQKMIQDELQPYKVLTSYVNLNLPDFSVQRQRGSPRLELESQEQMKIQIKCDGPVIDAELNITLIYVDGTHQLEQIQHRQLPKFTIANVRIDQSGFVLNSNNKTSFSLLDLFAGQVAATDLNYNVKIFVFEVEVIDSVGCTHLLRYLSYNQVSASIYPKIFVTIMEHLTSKRRPIRLAGYPFSQFTNEKFGVLDILFQKFVLKDLSFEKVMKSFTKAIPQFNLQPHVIVETPKQQIIIQNIFEYQICDQVNQKFSFMGLRVLRENRSKEELAESFENTQFKRSDQGFSPVRTLRKNESLRKSNDSQRQSGIDSTQDMKIGLQFQKNSSKQMKQDQNQSKNNVDFIVVNSNFARNVETENRLVTPQTLDQETSMERITKHFVTNIPKFAQNHDNLGNTMYNVSGKKTLHSESQISKQSLYCDEVKEHSVNSFQKIVQIIEQDSDKQLKEKDSGMNLGLNFQTQTSNIYRKKRKDLDSSKILEFNRTNITFPGMNQLQLKQTQPVFAVKTDGSMRRRSNLRYSIEKSKESQLIAGSQKFASTMEARGWARHNQMIAVINEQEPQDQNTDLVIVSDQLNNPNPYKRASEDDIINAELEKAANLTSYMGTGYEDRHSIESRKSVESHALQELPLVEIPKITVVYSTKVIKQ